MKQSRKWIFALSGASLLVGGIGFLHTSAGRPFLMSLGGCPIGKASPGDVERGRMEVARATRGTIAASTKPALGFELDRTTGADIRAWAHENHIACDEKREGTLFDCKNVPASALPAPSVGATKYDQVFLQLRETKRGALVNISAYRTKMTPAEAARQLGALADGMKAALGDPTSNSGERTADHLASPRYATSTFAYRFSNYVVDATAVNIDGTDVEIREHYMSATDAPSSEEQAVR